MTTEMTVIERQYDDETPASAAIVCGLNALVETDRPECDEAPPLALYEYVDPEAIDRIVGDGSGRGDVSITFAIGTCRVSVVDSGRVLVRHDPADR